MPISTQISADGSVLNIAVTGMLDVSQSVSLQDVVLAANDRVRVIRIDLAEVTSVDASIFSALLLINNELHGAPVVELLNCDYHLARSLSIAGIDRLIHVRLSLRDKPSEQQPEVSDLNAAVKSRQ